MQDRDEVKNHDLCMYDVAEVKISMIYVCKIEMRKRIMIYVCMM